MYLKTWDVQNWLINLQIMIGFLDFYKLYMEKLISTYVSLRKYSVSNSKN